MVRFRFATGAIALSVAMSGLAAAHNPKPGPSAAAAALPADLAEPAHSLDKFHRALADGDNTAALALLADEVLIFESGGAERGKAEYAAHHLAADAAFAQAVPRTVSRRSGHVAGDLAWLATESRVAGTYKGKPISSVSTETAVLRHVGGAWRITTFIGRRARQRLEVIGQGASFRVKGAASCWR